MIYRKNLGIVFSCFRFLMEKGRSFRVKVLIWRFKKILKERLKILFLRRKNW